MTSLDSGLRESMRLWGFVSRGVLKEVVAKEGVTMPDGLHLPMGVKVGVHSFPIHHDEDVYHNANAFEPLRFCSVIPDSDAESSDAASVKSAGSQAPRGIALVTTSTTWMPFSHGKHSWYVSPSPVPAWSNMLTNSQPRSLLCFPTTQARPGLPCSKLRNRAYC